MKSSSVNTKCLKCQRTKLKWKYFCLFEDGMSYHYFFDKETKKFTRKNMTSTGMNSFLVKNGRFPQASELKEIDSISIKQIKKTFAKELKLN